MWKSMTKENTPTLNRIRNSDHYDPDHPDADWGGHVLSKSYRKHIPSQPNQLAALNGNGFGPGTNVLTEEWTKPARKIVWHRESGAISTRKEAKSSTFTLIGGPVPEDRPSKFTSKCWETEAQAGTRTMNPDLQKVQYVGRRKRSIVNANTSEGAHDETQLPALRQPSPTKHPSDFIGFRSSNSRVTCLDKSFLAEVGKAVASITSSFP
jgi:hypothetical protein